MRIQPFGPALAWSAVTIALALGAFAPVLRNGYVLDDAAQVRFLRLPAPTVEGWVEAATYPWWTRRAWTAWRPVSRLTILAEKTFATKVLGTPAAWPFHAVSLLLHAIACLLVLALARRIGLPWPAAGTGAAFLAVHPLRSEAVHQIVGQTELLAAIFMTAGALAYVTARLHGHGAVRIALVQMPLYALALGSKEHAAAYPLYLALAEAGLAATGDGRDTLRARAKVFLPVVVSLALVAAGYLGIKDAVAGGIFQPGGTIPPHENPLAAMSLSERLPAALGVFGYVVIRTVFPVGLSPDYSAESLPVHLGWLWPASGAGAAVLVAILAYVVVSLRRGTRGWTLAVALLASWGFVSNLPFVLGTMLALRLFYLPMIPAALAAGYGWDRWRARRREARVFARGPDAALAIVLALLVVATWRFAPAWTSQIAFARHTVEVFPRSWRGNHNLASLLYGRGEHREGLVHARIAAELRPDDASSWNARGANAMHLEGHEAEAEEALRKSIALAPRFPPPYEHLARVLWKTGRREEALEAFEHYLRLAPSQHRRLAGALDALRAEIAGETKPSDD